jgi:DNA-binding CsgD family transcriptional regulator
MNLAMLAEALDMLDYALLIVDHEARIGFKNRAAAQVLEESETLQESEGGELTVKPRALSVQVRKAIHSAGVSARVAGMRIPKENGSSRWLGMIFMPMLLPEGAGSASRRVAIWVVDTEASASANERVLRTLFELSPAEARLALGMVAGQTLDEYARHAGVGVATVRTQLHSIFSKTGARRQAALVALLSKLPALKFPAS